MNIEDRIDIDEIRTVTAMVATPSALRVALRETVSARKLYAGLACKLLSVEDVRTYTQKLSEDFVPGEHFQHEAELSLIAVVFEVNESDLASDFLHDLASVHVAEMPMSPRVAVECLLAQAKSRGEDA